MSDDPFRTWDGPYVLGALSKDDRAAFEEHLRTCADCREAVGELAGLPGLLSRARPPRDDPADGPAPDLLPALLAVARRDRRRRRLLGASGWLAAAACAAGLALVALPAEPADAVVLSPMQQVGDTTIAGEAGVQAVRWGARIEVRCRYAADEDTDESYALRVFDRAGGYETVGSWKPVPGRTTTMDASTAIAGDDIGKLEVLSGNDVVLRLPR